MAFGSLGSKFFPFREDPFSKWFGDSKSNRSQKFSPFYKMMGTIHEVYPFHLTIYLTYSKI